MIERTYVLTIRDAPKSVNAGGGGSRVHWGTAHKEKKRWEGLYVMELLAAKVPKPMQFVRVAVTIRFKRKNHADSSNYFQPVYKPLLDALQAGGWLADDTDEWVAAEPIHLEYPEQWPHTDPRVKSEMLVKLEASYL